MNTNQHIEQLKQILKKEKHLFKAKAYINEQNIDVDEKANLMAHAQSILRKNRENKMAWTLVSCLAASGLFIFATYFVVVKYSANAPNINELLDTIDIFLFRVIPIGTALLSLIIATVLSEEESYGMRYIRASVVSALVCYILAFFVVLVRSLG
ncbi:hypothetical protein [Lacinutrix chionoecetis]